MTRKKVRALMTKAIRKGTGLSIGTAAKAAKILFGGYPEDWHAHAQEWGAQVPTREERACQCCYGGQRNRVLGLTGPKGTVLVSPLLDLRYSCR